MPFVPHKVQTKAMAGGTGLSVSLQKSQNGAARTMIFMSAAVAAGVGLKNGDKIGILLGTDESHGLLRLRVDGDGTAVVAERRARGGAYYSIGLGRIDLFVNRKEPKKFCKFEVVDDCWIEIALPAWADETNPRKRTVPVVKPAPTIERRFGEARPPLGQRTTDLTSRLQGDPPPGRSALNNRGEAELEQASLRRAEDEGRRENERIAREERRGAQRVDLPGDAKLVMRAPSPTERKVLAVLIDGVDHSNAEIAKAVGTISPSSVPPNISNLRRKLRTAGISIETTVGGFVMKPEMAERARTLLQT